MKLLVENGANINAENEVGGHSLLYICMFLTTANCIVYCSSQTFIFRVPFVFGLPLLFGGSLALLYGSHMSDCYMDNHTLVAHIQTFVPQKQNTPTPIYTQRFFVVIVQLAPVDNFIHPINHYPVDKC